MSRGEKRSAATTYSRALLSTPVEMHTIFITSSFTGAHYNSLDSMFAFRFSVTNWRLVVVIVSSCLAQSSVKVGRSRRLCTRVDIIGRG